MSRPEFTIHAESPADLPQIIALNARAVGPGRFARTAYRIREGGGAAPALNFAAWADGRLAGSIRFTALCVGGEPGALLLGPLTVEPEFAGRGCGRMLIAHGMAAAKEQGFGLVLLVGDLSYYARAGFVPVPRGQIGFPGPVDPGRILAAELRDGALAAARGEISALPDTR